MESVIKIVDNSGVKTVKCFHVNGSTGKRFAYVGDVCKASVNPGSKLKKGDKVSVMIVATKKEHIRNDGSVIRCDDNYCVLMNENITRVLSPVFREIRYFDLKIASLAFEVL